MLAGILAGVLTVLTVVFCCGAVVLSARPEDTDIDTILANAEKPFYEKTT